jgi:hypothetical protein
VTADVPLEKVLAAVRSVTTAAPIPAPRKPADGRDCDGWQRVGGYEIRFDEVAPRSAADGATVPGGAR